MSKIDDGGPALPLKTEKPKMPSLRGTPADRYHLSERSRHEGHDPADPRVWMVEEMAIDQCGACAEGIHRWFDPHRAKFVHHNDFGYKAYECDAHNTLLIAVEHDVPIYTGAELEFPDDDATSVSDTGGEK